MLEGVLLSEVLFLVGRVFEGLVGFETVFVLLVLLAAHCKFLLGLLDYDLLLLDVFLELLPIL